MQITIKGKRDSTVFDDEGTAILWGNYRTRLSEEIEKFGIPNNEKFTIYDAFYVKYGEKSREFIESKLYFSDVFEMSIADFTYEKMKAHCEKLLATKIQRGGGKSSGRIKYPSPTTILRKFAYLSAAINHMNDKGFRITNEALRIVSFLRELKENPYGES